MFGYKSKSTKLKDKLKAAEKKQNEKILAKAQKIIDDKEKKDKVDAEEPFLNLKGLIQQADGKIKIELDWDDNFVKKLKEVGYTGPDENSIIQKYLLELTSGIADDMGGESDYE